MARTLYSHNFIRNRITGGDVQYTVAEGFVAIVRDIDVITYGNAGMVVDVLDQEALVTFWFAGPATTAQTHWQWSGRQVFDEGRTFQAQMFGTGTADVSISGYLLTLP